jgi:chorismate mutase
MAVRGIRGAVTVDCDRAEEIITITSDLLKRMVSENGVEEDDIIHIMFTATPDITSAFPATAARVIGWVDTPLISAVEMNVPGSLERCIRVLMTVHSSRTKQEIRHVYLGRARELRPDLARPE